MPFPRKHMSYIILVKRSRCVCDKTFTEKMPGYFDNISDLKLATSSLLRKALDVVVARINVTFIFLFNKCVTCSYTSTSLSRSDSSELLTFIHWWTNLQRVTSPNLPWYFFFDPRFIWYFSFILTLFLEDAEEVDTERFLEVDTERFLEVDFSSSKAVRSLDKSDLSTLKVAFSASKSARSLDKSYLSTLKAAFSASKSARSLDKVSSLSLRCRCRWLKSSTLFDWVSVSLLRAFPSFLVAFRSSSTSTSSTSTSSTSTSSSDSSSFEWGETESNSDSQSWRSIILINFVSFTQSKPFVGRQSFNRFTIDLFFARIFSSWSFWADSWCSWISSRSLLSHGSQCVRPDTQSHLWAVNFSYISLSLVRRCLGFSNEEAWLISSSNSLKASSSSTQSWSAWLNLSSHRPKSSRIEIVS